MICRYEQEKKIITTYLEIDGIRAAQVRDFGEKRDFAQKTPCIFTLYHV